ncbi:serine/threonine-protein kinase [Gordonia sp. MP11Mi]|uniref:non-specific serine/threonine protein kinase n=1 Tax=Gordonia sp. MP11Mi TaxID=3022769 RepID=A0AA97GV14_9ACTN
MEPTEIAGYRVVRQIGAGGMGQVFLVEHPRLPRRDALKLLDAGVSRSADFKARFQREADMLAQFNHPNVVTLYDRGEVDGRLWITMEYVDGTDAAALLTEQAPLDPELALTLISGTGAALDYAWRKSRVTHRDVKPANILVGLDNIDGVPQLESVKLADFGIAKAAGEATSLTSTGMTVGTMQYVSPEAIEGLNLDNRADLYSLGCTAFHLLTGRPPYAGTSITALLSAHLTQIPPRASDVAPHLPAAVDGVVAKALMKNPNDRYGSCAEFVDALHAAVARDTDPAFARTMTAATLPPVPSAKWPRVLAIAAAVLAVVIGGAALGLYLTHDGGSDRTSVVATTSSAHSTTVASRSTTSSAPATPDIQETLVTPTVTVEETVPTATQSAPYEGMPCDVAEFNTTSTDGTLYCSAMDGAWRDKTNQTRPAVQRGAPCSEPGARARIQATDSISTCSPDSSGGYSWQD